MAWAWTSWGTSSHEAMIFSIPIITTCTFGALATSLALPSLVSMITVPVSATPDVGPGHAHLGGEEDGDAGTA